MSVAIRLVRIGVLVHIGALIALTGLSLPTIWEEGVIIGPGWFAYLALLIAPYESVIWLLDKGRLELGLRIAHSYACVFCFTPLAWILIPDFVNFAWVGWAVIWISVLS